MADPSAVRLSRLRPQLLFVTAVLCLLSSWYFAAVIAPAGLGLSAPSVQQGLFPEWFGCREILHHRDPYRAEATRQIELVIFGRAPAAAAAPLNQHRFAYPVFFVFLFFPIALLPFATAQVAAFFVCVFLTAISLPLWLPGPQFSNLDKTDFHPVRAGHLSHRVSVATSATDADLSFSARRSLLLGAVGAAGAGGNAGGLLRLETAACDCRPAPFVHLVGGGVAYPQKSFLLSLGATLSALLIAAEFADARLVRRVAGHAGGVCALCRGQAAAGRPALTAISCCRLARCSSARQSG